VNKQRLNALATFEAFVASTSDPATKSAVLLQAMASIFALQRTKMGWRIADIQYKNGRSLWKILKG
jgi:hypothetical protein